MRMLILIAAVAALPLSASAATPQQEKMTACNAEAKTKNLAGDERKKFMSECLSAAAPAAPAAGEKQLTPQQAKMKSCNADASAKALKGDDRKKFMSQCLKG